MTLIFLPAARAGAITPEAQEVLDILERRILSAEAGQASRDLFLETLGTRDGCRDWAEDQSWKRDPDLSEAVEAACPDLVGEAGEKRRVRPRRKDAKPAITDRGTVRLRERDADAPPAKGRFGLTQGMRPLEEGPSPPPELSGRLSAPMAGPGTGSPWIGGETTLSGQVRQRRRIWFEMPSFTVQAGGLAFGSDAAAGAGGADGPKSQGIPHLSFITGRRTFPGSGWLSGVEGAWEARSPTLDGLALTAQRAGWRAGGFATWNRRLSLSVSEAMAGRRDASVFSLSLGKGSGPWDWSFQAARQRLETAGNVPNSEAPGGEAPGGEAPDIETPASTKEIWVGGAALQRSIPAGADAEPGSEAGSKPGNLRAGLAVSHLRGESMPLSGESGESGGYAELEWVSGNPDQYSLGLRQATARWANPLSAAPALSRDTLEAGWLVPGRGEGGFTLRSRMELFQAGPWRASAITGGDAAWSLPGGFLAGSGRLILCLGAGAWEGRFSRGMAWRKDGLAASGSPILGAQSLIWKDGPWKVEAVLSRREGRNRNAWPFRLEAAWNSRTGNRWRLEGSSEDFQAPQAAYRIACMQAWRIGKGVNVLQNMSLPLERSAVRKDMGYRLGMEIQGF